MTWDTNVLTLDADSPTWDSSSWSESDAVEESYGGTVISMASSLARGLASGLARGLAG
jgi:hypothetical protein